MTLEICTRSQSQLWLSTCCGWRADSRWGSPKAICQYSGRPRLPASPPPIVAPLSWLAGNVYDSLHVSLWLLFFFFHALDERQQRKQLRFGNVVSSTDSNHGKQLSAQSNKDEQTLCGWPTRQSRERKSCPSQRPKTQLSGYPTVRPTH